MGGIRVDHPRPVDLGVVADPLEQPVGHARRAARAGGDGLGAGRGARELTGLGDSDVIGREVNEVLGLEWENGDRDHVATALEWGVRVLDKTVVVHAEGDRPEPAMADIFPAYDEDGGLLIVLTPKNT